MTQYGPKNAFSDQLHAEKYRASGEDFREAMTRIAGALADGDDHFRSFRDIIGNQRFLPAGRVQAAMGATKRVTPYNCYVSGTIEDSLRDDPGSILERFSEAAETMRMGGGIGYDFSTLRPSGALVKSVASSSSGPVSFMEIFNSLCHVISSAGHRRGAQMGIMRIDHPDIERFVRVKHNEDKLTGFNVSVAVTDEFMQALVGGAKSFDLKFNGETYKTVDPAVLWETVMRSTWDWAEPGVIFIDQINRMNNLHYCETIAATNPCGEQPLPPYGACLLGSFNLVKYVRGTGFHGGEKNIIDEAAFERDVFDVVRAMDNVVDRAIYPLPEQEQEAKSKRRMGLGVTGLANALEACGMSYGSQDFVHAEALILDKLRDAAYLASVELAQEKGAFPLFDKTEYPTGQFIDRLPDPLKEAIARHGIRNSHLTSIAPTGTISLTADNVSSGIEPVFAYEVDRTVRMDDGVRQVKVKDYGLEHFCVKGKRVQDVTLAEHRDVLLAAHHRVDSSVSKTCNVPADTPWEDFKQLYVDVWESGGKGCTTYTVGGQRGAVMESADEDEIDTAAACRIDSETGRRECD